VTWPCAGYGMHTACGRRASLATSEAMADQLTRSLG